MCNEPHGINLSPLSHNNNAIGGGIKPISPTPQGFVGSQLIVNSLGLNSLNQVDQTFSNPLQDNLQAPRNVCLQSMMKAQKLGAKRRSSNNERYQ